MPANVLPPAPAQTLTSMILDAYRAAVDHVYATFTGEELYQEKNRLFWGYRQGSKVDGVRDQGTVELLFRRITANEPATGYPKLNADGEMVYVFKLTQQYAHKGKSIYGRLYDIVNSHNHDRVGIGMDFEESVGEPVARLQAPKLPHFESDSVTIIMSGDNTKFIAWCCGEPKQVWTKDNITDLLLPDGTIDIGQLMVRGGLDYDIRTKEMKHRMKLQKFHARQQKKQTQAQVNPPINNLGQALLVPEVATVQTQ